MAYWFRIPSLPRSTYAKMKQLCETFSVTQRDVVIAGVRALVRLGQTDPAAAKELLTQGEHE